MMTYEEDLSFCDSVATQVNALMPSANAYMEDTAGGNVCVHVQFGSIGFYFGTANDTWGGSSADYENAGEIYIEAHISTEETDPAKVAFAIVAAILAQGFSAVLASWLTPAEMVEVWERNASQTDPHICHSHDFCDANMAMHEAWERIIGKGTTPIDFETDSPQQLAAMNLWNAAWDRAKADKFIVS